MEWFFVIVGGLALVGVVLAVWEWRRKRVFMAHDMNLHETRHSLATRHMIKTNDPSKPDQGPDSH